MSGGREDGVSKAAEMPDNGILVRCGAAAGTGAWKVALSESVLTLYPTILLPAAGHTGETSSSRFKMTGEGSRPEEFRMTPAVGGINARDRLS